MQATTPERSQLPGPSPDDQEDIFRGLSIENDPRRILVNIFNICRKGHTERKSILRWDRNIFTRGLIVHQTDDKEWRSSVSHQTEPTIAEDRHKYTGIIQEWAYVKTIVRAFGKAEDAENAGNDRPNKESAEGRRNWKYANPYSISNPLHGPNINTRDIRYAWAIDPDSTDKLRDRKGPMQCANWQLHLRR